MIPPELTPAESDEKVVRQLNFDILSSDVFDKAFNVQVAPWLLLQSVRVSRETSPNEEEGPRPETHRPVCTPFLRLMQEAEEVTPEPNERKREIKVPSSQPGNL